MAKQEFVTHLTPREKDFPQWYTDVILKTEMVDYAPVRGCMVIRPYGYRLWELIQEYLDEKFKNTGHQNVYFPMLIPESLLKKEAEHVEGFAPEVAWVTRGGHETLTEPLVIRPTSETLFCSMYAKWVQSYRDLPMLYNQWCSVMRWEKTTRPFLRTAEFLWQEGHTVHETSEEAEKETLQILDIYKTLCEDALAMPVFYGKKSDREKFAGAVATYGVESMMQDGKALQSATSHFFGTKFSVPFNITYLSREGKQEYVHETSWGASTRLIGGIVMVHGDERGLCMPPRVAPVQVVILPIAAHKPGVNDAASVLSLELKNAGVRVELDDRDTVSAGWKFNEWEMKGVPIRLEIGPKDIENGQVMLARRDTREKFAVSREGVAERVIALLDDVHATMFKKAKDFLESHTYEARDYEELRTGVQTGFVKAMWCGCEACEDKVKADMAATTRVIPFEQEKIAENCIVCGKPAEVMVYFAKSY